MTYMDLPAVHSATMQNITYLRFCQWFLYLVLMCPNALLANCPTSRVMTWACAETALRLEQRGLALTWSGLRFAYSMGGDGASDVRCDARNMAAFVRDPAALVTCLLLPHNFSARLEMQARLLPACWFQADLSS